MDDPASAYAIFRKAADDFAFRKIMTLLVSVENERQAYRDEHGPLANDPLGLVARIGALRDALALFSGSD